MRWGRRTIEHLNCGALLATLPFMRFRVSSFLGRLSLVTVGIVLAASNAAADEGQWTPDQISQLDFEMMKARGLDLSAQQLWDPDGDERSGVLRREAVARDVLPKKATCPEKASK